MKTYHVRLNVAQLQALRQRPAELWSMTANSEFDDAALVGIGEDFDVLARCVSISSVGALMKTIRG